MSGTFNEKLHPRDRRGKFAHKLGALHPGEVFHTRTGGRLRVVAHNSHDGKSRVQDMASGKMRHMSPTANVRREEPALGGRMTGPGRGGSHRVGTSGQPLTGKQSPAAGKKPGSTSHIAAELRPEALKSAKDTLLRGLVAQGKNSAEIKAEMERTFGKESPAAGAGSHHDREFTNLATGEKLHIGYDKNDNPISHGFDDEGLVQHHHDPVKAKELHDKAMRSVRSGSGRVEDVEYFTPKPSSGNPLSGRSSLTPGNLAKATDAEIAAHRLRYPSHEGLRREAEKRQPGKFSLPAGSEAYEQMKATAAALGLPFDEEEMKKRMGIASPPKAAASSDEVKAGDTGVPMHKIPVGSVVKVTGYHGYNQSIGKVGNPITVGDHPTADVRGRYRDIAGQWDYVDPTTTFDVVSVPSGKKPHKLYDPFNKPGAKADAFAKQAPPPKVKPVPPEIVDYAQKATAAAQATRDKAYAQIGGYNEYSDNEYSVGRGPKGNVRNVKAMSDGKLVAEWYKILGEHPPDNEVLSAWKSEMRKRNITITEAEARRIGRLREQLDEAVASGANSRVAVLRQVLAVAESTLSSESRKKLPKSAFAIPPDRYPIHDESHARNALSRVAQHGTPDEKAKVRAAVHRRYPNIGKAEEGWAEKLHPRKRAGGPGGGEFIKALRQIAGGHGFIAGEYSTHGERSAVKSLVDQGHVVAKWDRGADTDRYEVTPKGQAALHAAPLEAHHKALLAKVGSGSMRWTDLTGDETKTANELLASGHLVTGSAPQKSTSFINGKHHTFQGTIIRKAA